ncbi:MAG TPA: FAD-binding oxidoreductase, partial [Nitriliruptorales bacterium]
MRRERSWWGWGYEDAHLDGAGLEALGAELHTRFGGDFTARDPARPQDVAVPPPTVEPPDALVDLVVDDPVERLRHAHGQAFRDVVRAFAGEVPRVPDLVAYPRTPEGVAAVLEWCTDAGIACVAFGGGTSVVGGVNPPDEARAVLTLNLARLDRVTEVDTTSLAAQVQAGALGPSIDAQLHGHGLTLRHFPQSWEFSTLGGWIATRAGGHFATGPTHIDDLVEAVTAVTPSGTWASRRLPASGAGPSPDRLLLGSEGTLGVITEAWVRVQRRPIFRASATVTFPDFLAGGGAVRALAQSGLQPANCRLLDPGEAALTGASQDGALLVLGFESADHPVEPWMDRALELAADHGGTV